jgi:ribosome maturation factor RimP
MNPITRTYKEQIEKLILPVIESGGMELVDAECLKMVTRWLVRIFIDKEGGVTLDDCSAISREVGDLLDVHGIPPGPYTLEVSSPGLDRPLVKDGDFLKYLGHRVKVKAREKVEGVRHFRGRLTDFVDDGGRKILILHVEGRSYRVPREIVIKANLEYEA